jgi:hypothetical protein
MSIRGLPDWVYGITGVATVQNKFKITVGTSATKILDANAKRKSLTIVNLGDSDSFLYTDQSVAVGEGIFVGALGGSVSLNDIEDGDLVKEAFYGIAYNTAVKWLVIEVVYT